MPRLVEEVTLSGHDDRVWNLAWSPSGNLLASCGGDKTIRLWGKDKNDGKWSCKAILEDSHQRTIRSLAWSPDGKHLAAASFDATTSVWEYNPKSSEFECIATLEGHENEVKSVAWDSTGALLATCSRDKSVWIWEMEADNEFECISVLHGHSQDVKRVLWHPVKELLFSGGYDDTIKIWKDDEDDWFCDKTLTGHKSTVWDLAFNKKGDRLVSCSDDTTLIVWNTKSIQDTPKNICTISGHHTRTIFSVDWGINDVIATGCGDNAIRMFKQNTEENINNASEGESYQCTLSVENAHLSDVNCVRWNPEDANILASASDDMTIKIWKYE